MEKKINQSAGGNVTNMVAGNQINTNNLEIHHHYYTLIERKRIIAHLMEFQKSDPAFFKLLQDICTELHGNFMFSKLDDSNLKTFMQIKSLVFTLYQQKENHRLDVIQYQQQLDNAKQHPLKFFMANLLAI